MRVDLIFVLIGFSPRQFDSPLIIHASSLAISFLTLFFNQFPILFLRSFFHLKAISGVGRRAIRPLTYNRSRVPVSFSPRPIKPAITIERNDRKLLIPILQNESHLSMTSSAMFNQSHYKSAKLYQEVEGRCH